MNYMGSKRLLAKYLLPIILKDRQKDQRYIEPFVGGANIFQYVPNPKCGYDSHKAVIDALLLIRDHPTTLPRSADEISPELYQAIKKDINHPWHGYVGFACSFGGKYFGGRVKKEYAGDKEAGISDRVTYQYYSAQVQSTNLKESILGCRDYTSLCTLNDCIIYCDPPYAGTTSYKTTFDHTSFWGRCRKWVKLGNKVFISEYTAPDDFVCVWEKQVRKNLSPNNQKSIERLFVHNSQA